MREDMAKVIVERPRYGSWYRTRNRKAWKQIPWDEQPRGIGMKRQWKIRKNLNENLNPLFRFLNSHVGQPWNDVYSEIRERINMNSAVQFHIWQHVQQYVCWHAIPNNSIGIHHAFFVDPESGILERYAGNYHWGRRKPRQKPTVVERGEHGQFRRVEGVWRNLIFKRLPREWETVWDAYFKTRLKHVGLQRLVETYRRAGVYTVAVLPPTKGQLKGLPK